MSRPRLGRALLAGAAVLATGGGAAVAASRPNVVPVKGTLAIATSRVQAKGCAGGFNATARARVVVRSANPRLAGVMRLVLRESASPADDAAVVASGPFVDRRTGVKKGTAQLTAVDHGDELDGIYVIKLLHGRGTIYGNTSSHQDSLTTAHGRIGPGGGPRPANPAVLVRGRC